MPPGELPKYHKYTLNFTPRSMAALGEAAKLNEETRTDVINRGVRLYLLLSQLHSEGWTLVARNDEGDERLIHLV